MILDTKDGCIVLTEIKNVNGSMDNCPKMKSHMVGLVSEWVSSHRLFKENIFGFIVQEFGENHFRVNLVEIIGAERYTKLLEFFESDKVTAIEHGRRLSVFLVK